MGKWSKYNETKNMYHGDIKSRDSNYSFEEHVIHLNDYK